MRNKKPFRMGFERTEKEESLKAQYEDALFIAAMQAAIEQGKEHPTVGIVKDESPLVGARFHAEPNMSCCGSQASLCADEGTRWERNR